jgi:hypothetical protein
MNPMKQNQVSYNQKNDENKLELKLISKNFLSQIDIISVANWYIQKLSIYIFPSLKKPIWIGPD